MIDLDLNSLQRIKIILKKHVPGVEVRAFGSRVSGGAKKFSDVDLVIIGNTPVPNKVMNELRFEFSNSDLPIMVDIIDWHKITKEFQEKIQSTSEVFISSKS